MKGLLLNYQFSLKDLTVTCLFHCVTGQLVEPINNDHI